MFFIIFTTFADCCSCQSNSSSCDEIYSALQICFGSNYRSWRYHKRNHEQWADTTKYNKIFLGFFFLSFLNKKCHDLFNLV